MCTGSQTIFHLTITVTVDDGCSTNGYWCYSPLSNKNHLYGLAGPPVDVDLAVAPGCVDHHRAGRGVGVVAVWWKLVSGLGDDDFWCNRRAHGSCTKE